MSRTYLIEKGVSASLVAVAVYLLEPREILNLFIVLGQGHFALAYIYQYKAGKIGARYLAVYAILFTALLSVFLLTNSYDWLVVIAGTQFLLHFLQDEIFLFKGTHSFFTSLEGLSLATLYFGLLYDRVFSASISGEITFIVIGMLFLYVVVALKHAYRPVIPSWPVLVGIVFLLMLQFTQVVIPIEILLGSVILFHYFEWYVHFFYKLESNTAARNQYLIRVVYVNMIVIGLYLLFVHYFNRDGVLGYLFFPFYFYIWTLMHTLTSIRFSDYKTAFKLP